MGVPPYSETLFASFCVFVQLNLGVIVCSRKPHCGFCYMQLFFEGGLVYFDIIACIFSI